MAKVTLKYLGRNPYVFPVVCKCLNNGDEITVDEEQVASLTNTVAGAHVYNHDFEVVPEVTAKKAEPAPEPTPEPEPVEEAVEEEVAEPKTTKKTTKKKD